MLGMMAGMPLSSLLWLLGLSVVIGGAGAAVGLTGVDTEARIIGAVFAAVGMPGPIVFLVGLVRFARFRGWRARLPFPLTGNWEALAGIDEEKTWFPCKLAIVLREPGGEGSRNVAALLRIFCVHANSSQFRPELGTIRAWKANGLTADGDAGGRVPWKLYRFIAKDLVRLPIAEVRVLVGKGHTVTASTVSTS